MNNHVRGQSRGRCLASGRLGVFGKIDSQYGRLAINSPKDVQLAMDQCVPENSIGRKTKKLRIYLKKKVAYEM